MKLVNYLFFITKHILLGIILIFSFLLISIPYSQQSRHAMAYYLKQFIEHALSCHTSFTVESFCLINPSIQLTDVTTLPHATNNGSWGWHCKHYSVSFSWLRFFRNGTIDLTMELDGLTAYSTVTDNNLALAHHLNMLLQDTLPPVACFIKYLNINNAALVIYNSDHATELHVALRCCARKIDNIFKSTINILDAQLLLNNKPIITDFIGTLALNSKNTVGGPSCWARLDTRFNVPCARPTDYFFSGTWEHDHGRFLLRNADDSCSINPIIINRRNGISWLNINAQIPLSQVCAVAQYTQIFACIPVEGTCLLRLMTSLDKGISSLDGHLLFDNLRLPGKNWFTVSTLSINKRAALWAADLTVRTPGIVELKGTGKWHEQTRIGSCSLSNTSALQSAYLPYWKIEPGDLSFSVQSNAAGNFEGPFSCTAVNKMVRSSWNTQGTSNVTASRGVIRGMLGPNEYQIRLCADRFPFLEHIEYRDDKGDSLLSIDCMPPHEADQTPASTAGHISMHLIRSCMQQYANQQIQAEGAIAFHAEFDAHKIAGTIALENGTIRLPHTYNFINDVSARLAYELPSSTLTITDAVGTLHTGSVQVPHATLRFNQQYGLTYAHVPILIDRCLLNMHQELFAMISGSLFLQTTPHEHFLSGNVILDKSHLKENILAETVQKQLTQHAQSLLSSNHHPILCAISLETKEPMQVETAFLQATASAHLALKNKITDPDISGTVKFLSGSLSFPYKPLHLTKGSLLFIPEQRHNPVIELSAKNSIKKHTITLQVTGSLLNHDLIFESSPPLTEEQIISLLTVGSQESLNVMAPAFIMQNVQKLLFGTKQSSILERYFKPLAQHIHLVPSFIDQSGRGGLRGALEIDINDRLRATIQKNFTLSEDTRVELEYAATDDVTVRGIRNERRDLGAEVEMRWKF